jgi:hypothetical protein
MHRNYYFFTQLCHGLDLYNFLPEAFTFRDFFVQIFAGVQRTDSYWDLPVWVIQHRDRFNWILPDGNCKREE